MAHPQPFAPGDVEVVHEFHGAMPTGVAVSDDGRRFVCFPKWGDDVPATVCELRDGEEVAYPSAQFNAGGEDAPADRLVSVQSVVVDPTGARLWLLDTGSVEMGPVLPGGAKLVCVDLATDEVVRTISFAPDVVPETTYLNDVRFDLARGEAGTAYITDSGTDPSHPMGIIVVDLASGRSWRRLGGHVTVKPERDHLASFDGQPVAGMLLGSDGIALSADATRLFYCPFASRRLYSVDAAALAEEGLDEAAVVATIADHGQKGAADGLETDDRGRVYATNYEHKAIIRTSDDGASWEPVAHRQEMLFVDTLAVAADRHVYFTSNQLQRQAQFQGGEDRRERPYLLGRVAIDAGPVRA